MWRWWSSSWMPKTVVSFCPVSVVSHDRSPSRGTSHWSLSQTGWNWNQKTMTDTGIPSTPAFQPINTKHLHIENTYLYALEKGYLHSGEKAMQTAAATPTVHEIIPHSTVYKIYTSCTLFFFFLRLQAGRNQCNFGRFDLPYTVHSSACHVTFRSMLGPFLLWPLLHLWHHFSDKNCLNCWMTLFSVCIYLIRVVLFCLTKET